MSAAVISRDGNAAVVGSGAMGAGIAQVAALAGHTVSLYDIRPGAAAGAVERLRALLVKLAEKGKLAPEAAAAAGRRLHAVEDLAALAGAGLVIEAIAEDLAAKRRLFAELETIVDADCLLASNTSSLSITALAAGLRHPQRLLGMHFFNPAPLMELVEVVPGVATAPACLEAALATARRWGKSPVVARSTPGFIVNRVARPFYGEGLRLLQEGAAGAATLDALLRDAGGFRMGPFELMDLIGLDINYEVTRSVFEGTFGDRRYAPSPIQQELVQAGRLGRKTGCGYYDYADGATPPAPEVEPPATAAPAVRLTGDGPLVEALRARLESSLASAAAVRVAVTDGRTAARRAAEEGDADLVLVDLALDYAAATRIGVARAPGCAQPAWQAAVAALQAAGFAVCRLRDLPGLAVMRTVAMLVNEAADAVHFGTASAADVDTAMRKGVNYPRGPLAWGDAIGVGAVTAVLEALHAHYGEERYRLSPLLRQCVWQGKELHAAGRS